jgi:hypothetical protein
VFHFVHGFTTPAWPAARAYVVELPTGIGSKQQLLEVIAAKLKFPSHFGMNWDALSDCLRDLSWIPNQLVVLMHRDLPTLEADELRLYVEVLADTSLDWRRSPEQHELVAVFPESQRARVESLVDQGQGA